MKRQFLYAIILMTGMTAMAAPQVGPKPLLQVPTKMVEDLELDDLEPLPENENEGHISASELDAEFLSELNQANDKSEKRE